jgi:hypothetical protein
MQVVMAHINIIRMSHATHSSLARTLKPTRDKCEKHRSIVGMDTNAAAAAAIPPLSISDRHSTGGTIAAPTNDKTATAAADMPSAAAIAASAATTARWRHSDTLLETYLSHYNISSIQH